MLVVADLEVTSSFVSLDTETMSYAKWLTVSQLIHLLLPVKKEIPEWAGGALQTGMLGVSMAWHPDLHYLLDQRGYIFASSANITGDTPIGTAAEVDEIFQGKMLVIDADSVHDAALPASGMIVKVSNGKETTLVRPGFQNEKANTSPDDYVLQLPSLWRIQTLV